jgi:photosystem II core protein PsbZ
MITATTIISLVSLGLVITVPVALATPREWENSKALTTVSKGGYSLFLQLLLLTVLRQHLNLLEIIVLTIISNK